MVLPDFLCEMFGLCIKSGCEVCHLPLRSAYGAAADAIFGDKESTNTESVGVVRVMGKSLVLG